MSYISLDRLCGGALLERFNLAMSQIGNNILDPNTNPEKTRSVSIKITFKPDKGRRGIRTSIATSVSLAPPESDETTLLIGRDYRTGRVELAECGEDGQSISLGDGKGISQAQRSEQRQDFDQETGEIYENNVGKAPIDLRA